MAQVLITGSRGLLGSAISRKLILKGWDVLGLDHRLPADHLEHGDVRNPQLMSRLAQQVDAIVHLAAVSRVQWAEQDPDLCWQTNVGGTENVVRAAAASDRRPIVLTASSREIYGEPDILPVAEDTRAAPMNAYGRSKVAAEQATLAGRDAEINTAIARFSNVYGDPADHADRVVPAFARAASHGMAMHLCGRQHRFDFVHLDDATAGAVMLLEALLAGERGLPPIHLVTGKGTTLERLAEIANRAGGDRSTLHDEPTRTNDVSVFVGDPTRAEQLLGWRAEITIEHGMRQLVDDYAPVQLEPLDFGMRQLA